MEIKLISDGIAAHTRIINAETGEAIEGVVSIEWRIGRDGIAIAAIGLVATQVEVDAKLNRITVYHPNGETLFDGFSQL